MNEPSPADVGPPACPFVAFDDDRRRRSVEPDQRHRCYAESPPAPRTVVHQETYCLGADFADCPTFQEWARRQAAREVGIATGEAETAGPPPGEGAPRHPAVSGRRTYDWAAPPPWLADRRPQPDPDQLTAFDAFDAPATPSPPAPSAPSGDPELAALLRRAAPSPSAPETDEGELPAFLTGGGRPVAPRLSRPAMVRPPAARPLSQAHPAGLSLRRGARSEPEAPPWETPRHFEAYPAIRSRGRIPHAPGILLALVALGAAAILLVMLPSLLSAPTATATPTPNSSATGGAGTGAETASPEPTGEALPTTQVYVVVPNDTMSTIAGRLGVTVEDLLAANPQIKDQNKIQVGDQITVPAPATPEPLPGEGSSPSP
jgi:LysM repeat protein